MAKIEQRGQITCECIIRLTEAEIRFLDALVGYGWPAFIKVFEEKLGSAYSRDHHGGGKLFFETIGCATAILRRTDEARSVFEGSKVAQSQGAVERMPLLRAVADAARALPRTTPAPGGAGTEHPYQIEAAKVWALDLALKALDAPQTGT